MSRRYRLCLAAGMIVGVGLIYMRCKPPPPPPPSISKPPVFLMILVDVTKSLEKAEVNQVAKLAADVLDRFPDNTDYVIYPIQWETERPSAIDEAHPNTTTTIKLTDDDKTTRRDLISKEIAHEYKQVNERQPTDRTCILNTLDLADKHFHQITGGLSSKALENSCMELVIISDMIEQCALNSANVRIDLKEQSLSEATDRLKRISNLPNLSRVHITIIIPTSEESTPYALDRPRLNAIENFWNTVFGQCGFKREDLKDFNWLPTIPARLDRVCQ